MMITMKIKYFIFVLALGFVAQGQEAVRYSYGNIITSSGDTISHEAFGELCDQYSTSALFYYNQAQALKTYTEMEWMDKPSFRAGAVLVVAGSLRGGGPRMYDPGFDDWGDRGDWDVMPEPYYSPGRPVMGMGVVLLAVSTEMGDWLIEHLDYPWAMRRAVKFYNRDIQRIRK